MSFLRRAPFIKTRAVGGNFSSFSITSASTTGGTLATSCADVIAGYRQSPALGSISPGTFGGYTITAFNNRTTFFLDQPPACTIVDSRFQFAVSGYSGSQTGLFSKIVFTDGSQLLSSSVSSYSAGAWVWNDVTGFIIPAIVTGTYKIYP